MAFLGGDGTSFLFGAYDLSTFLNSSDADQLLAALETTTYQVAGSSKTFTPGLRDGKVSAAGLFDGAVTGIDALLQPILGLGLAASIQPLTYTPQGVGAIGNYCKLCQAQPTDYKCTSPVAGVVSVTTTFQPSGPLLGGRILEPLSAKTNTGNSVSSVDNLAASANGLIANIHYTAFTSGTATAKIQHSTDNSSWVDLITFTASTAIGSEQKTVAGTVNRYLRPSWATTFVETFAIAAARL